MTLVEFRCIGCGNPFSVPFEVIPKTGGKGRCTNCGKTLAIFPDGRIFDGRAIVPPPRHLHRPDAHAHKAPPAPPQSAPVERATPDEAKKSGTPITEKALWEIRAMNAAAPLVGTGPFRLSEMADLIAGGQIYPDDLARHEGGEWQPIRSFPALMSLFSEKASMHREEHGDPDHCALHDQSAADWYCSRCGDYLCALCVVERPLVTGGPPRPFCLNCEVPVDAVQRVSKKKRFANLFGKKRKDDLD